MATERQIEANRLNAARSTGPRTAEGKAVSRLNATTHGLAGEGGFVEAGLAGAFEARRESWAGHYQPDGVEAEAALDRLVAASFRIDQCDRGLDAVIARHSARAVAAWDTDRKLEAAEVASGLAKDPAVVALRLESTRHGCALMIAYWDRLGEAAASRRPWSDADSSTALDLLAVPRAFRDGPTPIDPRGDADMFDHRRDLALRELTRLGALESALAEFDDLDRRQAESGDVAILTAPAQLMIRYERDAHRRFHAAARALRQPAAPAAPKPVATPAPAPAPAPPRRLATPIASPAFDRFADDDDNGLTPSPRPSFLNISASRTIPSRN